MADPEYVLACLSHQRLALDITLEDFITQRSPMTLGDDGRAHIHVTGLLLGDAPGIHQKTGNTTYQDIIAETRAALEANATGIVYHVDSGGGAHAGLYEAMSVIMDASQKVPTETRTRFACSAAYLLSSCTNTITAGPTAPVGSIGVIQTHIDASAMMEAMGIRETVITNEGADLKGVANGRKLTEAQLAHLQENANQIGQEVRDHMDAARNVDPEVYRAGHYHGQRALDLGLVDEIDITTTSKAMIGSKRLQEQVEGLQTELDERQALLDKTNEQHKELAEQAGTLQAQLAEKEAEVEDLKAKLSAESTKVADLTASQSDFEAKVNDAVAAKLEEQGLTEPPPPATKTETPDIYTQYLSISDPDERFAFYKLNSNAIFEAQRKQG